MDVGLVNKTGNPGTVYLLLLDLNDNFVDQTTAVDVGNGVYNYSFNDVNAGAYHIVGGSDIDNDLFICQLAEVCGAYPTLNALSPINVSSDDITDLDFVVDILSNFGASRLSTQQGDKFKGFQRAVVDEPVTEKRVQ